jgi:adenylate cyclase
VDAAAILLLTVLCALAVLKFKPHWAAISAVSLCILYFIIAFSLFDRGIMLNMLHPPLALAATFAFVNVHNVVYERAEKSEITRTFGRYLFPPLVDKILQASREDRLKLGGETHEISVMFIDARRFTSLSENIRSEAVVNALNTYLGVIVDAIKKHGGMISNFGGDSIMAIWNVPIESDDHALQATKAAISTQRAIRELQEREPALLLMKFGIGVNTGNAVAGNMGSEDYLQYSVIGDVVNVAARLTGDAPGGKVWLGEQTLAAIGNCIDTKPLELLTLKGRHDTIQAYEVIDNSDLDIDEITYHDEKTKDKCNKS